MSLYWMYANQGGGTISATGEIVITDLALADETITVGGETFTFGTEINIEDGPFDMAEDLSTTINNATATTLCTCSPAEGEPPITLTLTANTPGAAGNSITLEEAATNVTVVGFSGGA